MTLNDFQQQYHQSYEQYQSYLKQSNRLSVLRFCVFILMIGFILYGYFQNIYNLYILSFFCLLLFIYCVYKHKIIKKKMLYYSSLNEVLKQHIQRINNQWDTFEIDGKEYIQDELSQDLDLFGHHSLFQFLNTTFTKQGKDKLANSLVNYSTDKKFIMQRQQAIQELVNHEEFLIELQTYGNMILDHHEDYIHQFIQKQSQIQYRPIPKYIILLPFITCLSFIATLLNLGHPFSKMIFEICLVLQLAITFILIRQHNQLFEPVIKLQHSLSHYFIIFQIIQNETFHSVLLVRIQNQISHQNNAMKGILKLSKISQYIAYRKNILLFILFNSLGLYDVFLRNIYLNWVHQYGRQMKQWFDALSDLEVLMSYYTPQMDDDDVCFANIENKRSLSFHNLRHPLINPQKVVGNDFQLEHPICMITGSNMSGKTTFMRTIALNLILAYNGGYVFADDLTCSCMKIMTSMRIKDNVEEGISTFYGELLRIKSMIEYSQMNLPMICFIDEIFKGTNSLDRIAGANATIEKLSLPHCLTFITTHDFELCQTHDRDISNYHFDEYYENDKIYFDYLIKKGQSQTTNGQFLLKQLGIK